MLENQTHLVEVYKAIRKFRGLDNKVIDLCSFEPLDNELKSDSEVIKEVLLLQKVDIKQELLYSLLWLEKNSKNVLLNLLLKECEDEKKFCSLYVEKLDTAESYTKLALSLSVVDAYIQYLDDGTKGLLTNIKSFKDLKLFRDNFEMNNEDILDYKEKIANNKDKMKLVAKLSSLPNSVLALELYTMYEYNTGIKDE